jgi:hypothetical protein
MIEKIKKDKEILEQKIKAALVEFTSKNSELCIYEVELKNDLCKIVDTDLYFVSHINVKCKIKIL